MKQTSGKYSEIELVKSDSAQDEENHGAEISVRMNSDEWDKNVQKLAAMFGGSAVAAGVPATPKLGGGGSPAKGAPLTPIKTGGLSPLHEDEGRYYATAVVKKAKDRMKLATVEWRKEPLEAWRARLENQ